MTVFSPLLSGIPGLVHGFGTLLTPIPAEVQPYWDPRKPKWQQVHGIDVVEVSGPAQECGKADALWTRSPDIPVSVMTADCVPILLARQDGQLGAAVHSGWRGTQARILEVLWNKLKSQGEQPANWVASIGPSIGPCCYEVSEELAQNFIQEFSSFGAHVISPRYRYLDLPAINQKILNQIGIGATEILRHCTRCSTEPLFHSYRREGAGFRQFSAVMIRSGNQVLL